MYFCRVASKNGTALKGLKYRQNYASISREKLLSALARQSKCTREKSGSYRGLKWARRKYS